MYKIAICFLACIASVEAVEIEMPMGGRVVRETKDESLWEIDPSMREYIRKDRRVINPPGRLYKFSYAKIGKYYLSGDNDSCMWDISDENDERICSCSVKIFPDLQSASTAALDYSLPWRRNESTRDNTYVEREKDADFYFYWLEEPMGKNPPEGGRPNRMQKDGVLLGIMWGPAAEKLTYAEQKALLLRFVEMIRSGKEHQSHWEELRKIKLCKMEEFKLRNNAVHRMSDDIPYHSGDINEVMSGLKKGSNQFVHPQKMWNRPSLKWLSQFQSDLADRGESSWNERGDYLMVKLPATKKRPAHQCLIYVAHATSEHNALQFLASFASAQGFERVDLRSDKKNHRINPRLVGEYDLALKPQLDATGALIPNAEESDICFIRNNTAVRVVADRRDVSVLWIARKIDEELIAAGKGEPPTWPPPKASAPASAAESK